MEYAKEFFEYGERLTTNMQDPRWPGEDGWYEMKMVIGEIEIHYVDDPEMGFAEDFKFKDWSEWN